MKLKDIFGAVVARGREPSTYTGLAILAGLVGYNVDPGLVKEISGVGMALAGAAAVIAPEAAKAVADVKAAVDQKPADAPAAP